MHDLSPPEGRRATRIRTAWASQNQNLLRDAPAGLHKATDFKWAMHLWMHTLTWTAPSSHDKRPQAPRSAMAHRSYYRRAKVHVQQPSSFCPWKFLLPRC